MLFFCDTMTWNAERNYIKPVLFFVSVVVMVLLGWLSAMSTLEAGSGRQLSTIYGSSNSASSFVSIRVADSVSFVVSDLFFSIDKPPLSLCDFNSGRVVLFPSISRCLQLFWIISFPLPMSCFLTSLANTMIPAPSSLVLIKLIQRLSLLALGTSLVSDFHRSVTEQAKTSNESVGEQRGKSDQRRCDKSANNDLRPFWNLPLADSQNKVNRYFNGVTSPVGQANVLEFFNCFRIWVVRIKHGGFLVLGEFRRANAIISNSLHIGCRGMLTAADGLVRAGSVFHHLIGSSHNKKQLRGLAGFLLRHLLFGWLHFIPGFRRFLQVELNRSKDFTIERAVIFLRALFKYLVKRVVLNANGYFDHAVVIAAFSGGVKPQLSGGVAW